MCRRPGLTWAQDVRVKGGDGMNTLEVERAIERAGYRVVGRRREV